MGSSLAFIHGLGVEDWAADFVIVGAIATIFVRSRAGSENVLAAYIYGGIGVVLGNFLFSLLTYLGVPLWGPLQDWLPVIVGVGAVVGGNFMLQSREERFGLTEPDSASIPEAGLEPETAPEPSAPVKAPPPPEPSGPITRA